MIPVRRRKDEVALVWDQNKADDHRLKVLACKKPEERTKYFKDNPYWRCLIPLFAHWSYGKCWYSEAKVTVHGAGFDADHFRPKGRADDPWNERSWEGYPWLAYDWTNLRLASPNTNRVGVDIDENTSGKGTMFPLRAPTSPVAMKADELDAERDYVLLIDPCDQDAVNHISFNDDGRAVCLDDNNTFALRCVDRTINVYNLNHPGFIEARQGLWRECVELLNEIKMLEQLERLETPSPVAPLCTKKRRELARKSRADQEFAGTVRAFACKRHEAWVRMAIAHEPSPDYRPYREVLDEQEAKRAASAPSPTPSVLTAQQVQQSLFGDPVPVAPTPRPKGAPKKSKASTIAGTVSAPSPPPATPPSAAVPEEPDPDV